MASQSLDNIKQYTKKRYSGKKAVSNLAKDIMFLKTMLNTEQKHIDTLTAPVTVVSTSSLVSALGTVAQGSSSSTRTGDSIRVRKMDFMLRFKYSTGTTNSKEIQHFKYWVVRYLKTPASAGTAPFSINEFLVSDQAGNYSTSSFHNPDTMQNFFVHSVGELDINLHFNVGTDSDIVKIVELSIDCDFHQTYNGSTGSTVSDNMVFLVCVATNAVNTGGSSELGVSSRLWFVDN